jgi:hypothetical protein
MAAAAIIINVDAVLRDGLERAMGIAIVPGEQGRDVNAPWEWMSMLMDRNLILILIRIIMGVGEGILLVITPRTVGIGFWSRRCRISMMSRSGRGWITRGLRIGFSWGMICGIWDILRRESGGRRGGRCA